MEIYERYFQRTFGIVPAINLIYTFKIKRKDNNINIEFLDFRNCFIIVNETIFRIYDTYILFVIVNNVNTLIS